MFTSKTTEIIIATTCVVVIIVGIIYTYTNWPHHFLFIGTG